MKKNRVKYLIIFLLSLLFVYLRGGVVPWSIFYFIIIFPLISFINLYIVYKSFAFQEKTNEAHYIKGDSIKYTCKIIMEHFLPLSYITLFIKTPETYITDQVDIKEIFISSKKTREFTYRVKCKYRGKYEMGIEKLEFLDILCLFKLSYFPVVKNTVTIFPKIKRVFESATKNVTLSQQKFSYYNKNKGDESTVNIREYMYGDSSKLIHWKLSSKLDELMITEKENVLDSQIILAIDLRKINMVTKKRIIYEDLLIEEVIATAYYYIKNNIPIDLIFYYDGIKSIHASTVLEFYKLYKVLAEVPFSNQSTLESVLFNSLNNKEKINTMYIFCLSLRNNIVNSLITLRNMGKQLTTKYCISENNAHIYLETNGITSKKIEIPKERDYIYNEK